MKWGDRYKESYHCSNSTLARSYTSGLGYEEQIPGSGRIVGGMMGYDMMRYEMIDDEGCPTMMNMARSLDYLLTYRDEFELPKTQVTQLKEIRDSY